MIKKIISLFSAVLCLSLFGNLNSLVYAISEDANTINTEAIEVSDNMISPDIADYFTTEHPDSGYVLAVNDNNMLHANVTVTVSALSDNINSIDLNVWKKGTPGTWYYPTALQEDDTYSFEVAALTGYKIWVRVNSGNISSTDEGIVTIYVED